MTRLRNDVKLHGARGWIHAGRTGEKRSSHPYAFVRLSTSDVLVDLTPNEARAFIRCLERAITEAEAFRP